MDIIDVEDESPAVRAIGGSTLPGAASSASTEPLGGNPFGVNPINLPHVQAVQVNPTQVLSLHPGPIPTGFRARAEAL
eukprot:3133479-Alexandrium_andersonii.AAC.1